LSCLYSSDVTVNMPRTRRGPHHQSFARIQLHPPALLVDVTSSSKLNYADDVNLPDRRRGPHSESFEEDSGFDDPFGHSTSNGGELPETDEELSTS
jgi:hypothetical protein